MLCAAQVEPATVTFQSRATAVAWLVAVCAVTLSFGFTEMAGSDMWWHVAAGREILQQQSVWLVDTWSYSAAGEAWRNHEWLADIVYFAWEQAWGIESLVYWKWLLLLGIFSCLFLALCRYSGGDAAAAGLATCLAIVIAAPFLDIRPHLWTLLGFVSLLLILSWQHPRLWVLVVLFLLWVNLHGGFVFGLMVLAIALVPWLQLRWTGCQPRAGREAVRVWLLTLRVIGDSCRASAVD